MNITKIVIESEGDVNGFFTVHFEDGTKQGGWSCDQGSIEWDDDKFDPDYEVGSLCMDLWFQMDIDDQNYECRQHATWTPTTGLSETTNEVA